MKLTINTDVLSKENITLGEFLVMLMGYYKVNYKECFDKLVDTGIIQPNLFKELDIVLSEKSKSLIQRLLVESDDKIVNCGINDFESLARALQMIYPHGNKPGTTYSWRGEIEEIAHKLRALIVEHNFRFTEKEAIDAVKEYVNSFKDFKYMHLLKFFILKTYSNEVGHKEIDSLFMTIIENNREKKDEDNT
jgi:hypothetical protein